MQEPSLDISMHNHDAIPELSTFIKAKLADLVYPESRNKLSPSGWVLKDFSHKLDHRINVYTNETHGVAYVVYCGTRLDQINIEAINDLYADIELVLGKTPTIYKNQIKDYVEKIYRKLADRYTIYHIGHSLGGVYANLAAIDFNSCSFTFDAPGCKKLIEDIDHAYSPLNHINYICYQNFINGFETQIGQVVNLGLPSRLVTEVAYLETWVNATKTQIEIFTEAFKNPPAALITFIKQQLDEALGKNLSFKFKIGLLTHSIQNHIEQLSEKQTLAIASPNLFLSLFESPIKPINETSTSLMKIWKQDPSFSDDLMRVVMIQSDSELLSGPSNHVVNVRILDKTFFYRLAPKNKDGNFFYDYQNAEEETNAAHTFAVVYKVWQMYKRALNAVGIPWSGKWRQGLQETFDPIEAIPNGALYEPYQNASYNPNENKLVFGEMRSTILNKLVQFCQSFDIVAHETGHAILHALKPKWMFNRASNPQSPALHEAFGDLTNIFAILSELDLCEWLICETKGDLRKNSPLASIGEEFGQAIDSKFGIRNINNTLKLGDTSLQAHDLSRVFTGAVYAILVEIYENNLNLDLCSHAETLMQTAKHLMQNFISAIYYSPDQNPIFQDVAVLMVLLEKNPQNKSIIRKHFTSRLIIDSPSAWYGVKELPEKKEKMIATSCCDNYPMSESHLMSLTTLPFPTSPKTPLTTWKQENQKQEEKFKSSSNPHTLFSRDTRISFSKSDREGAYRVLDLLAKALPKKIYTDDYASIPVSAPIPITTTPIANVLCNKLSLLGLLVVFLSLIIFLYYKEEKEELSNASTFLRFGF
jgi:hypothetical protein